MPAPANDPSPAQLRIIRHRLRLRFWFSGIVCLLYGGFALGYGPLQDLFSTAVTATSPIRFALVYFASLIILFLLLEFVYLKLADKSAAINRTAQTDKANVYAER